MNNINNFTQKEIYSLMDNSEYILGPRFTLTNVALDSQSRIIAVSTIPKKAYNLAFLRGCESPRIINAAYLVGDNSIQKIMTS